MSFSSLPSPPLQPFQQFPTSATSQETSHDSSSSSSSSGSYSQVLIVLGIIFVVSIVGCVVGRVCCKDGHFKVKQKHGSSKKKGKQGKGSHGFQPNSNDVDMEFGFQHKLKPIPSGKIGSGYEMNRGFQPPHGGWNGEVEGVMKGSGRVDGHMGFKNGPMPNFNNPGYMEFKHGPGPVLYN